MHRTATEMDGTFALREEGEPYKHLFADKNEPLRHENTHFWDQKA
jgi:hypothetical protein